MCQSESPNSSFMGLLYVIIALVLKDDSAIQHNVGLFLTHNTMPNCYLGIQGNRSSTNVYLQKHVYHLIATIETVLLEIAHFPPMIAAKCDIFHLSSQSII